MFVREQRSGLRSWTPGIFATLWVVLAGFSGAYLYGATSEPTGSSMASPVTITGSNPADAAKIADLEKANTDQAQQLAQAKDTIGQLNQQVAALNQRLKPIEKLLGPVAAMPQHEPATTAPPTSSSPPASEQADSTPPASDDSKPADTQTASVEPDDTPAPPHESAPAAETADDVPHGDVPSPTAKPSKPEPSASAKSDDSDSKPANDADTKVASAQPQAPTPPPAAPAPMMAPNLPPGTNRFGIELGASDKSEALKPMWHDLQTNHAALVAGLDARRVMAPDKQWRLVAGPFANASEAVQACALFKKVQLNCAPTVFAGDSL